jgi:hypothetical protein
LITYIDSKQQLVSISEREAIQIQRRERLEFLPEYFGAPTELSLLFDFCKYNQGEQIEPVEDERLRMYAF